MNFSCKWCASSFTPDNRNLKKGWGKCCSKRCAAKHREHEKMLERQAPKHFSTL